jgi:hypothetical protein
VQRLDYDRWTWRRWHPSEAVDPNSTNARGVRAVEVPLDSVSDHRRRLHMNPEELERAHIDRNGRLADAELT